jgi:hypothetical protein
MVPDNQGRALTIAVGIHKAFWYPSNGLLLSVVAMQMLRWRAFGLENQWSGGGMIVN